MKIINIIKIKIIIKIIIFITYNKAKNKNL